MKKHLKLIVIVLALLILIPVKSEAFDDTILLIREGHIFTVRFNAPLKPDQNLEGYVRIIDDYNRIKKSSIVYAAGDYVKIKLNEPFDPERLYRVSVTPGIKGNNGELLREKKERRFLPDYQTMLSLCEKLYNDTEGKESGMIKPDYYQLGSRRLLREKLDLIKQSKGASTLTRERELELVGELQQAVRDFKDRLWSAKSGEIYFVDNDATTGKGFFFSFAVKYNKESFVNELTGFRAILMRDQDPYKSTTINKEDYTDMDKLEGKVYYKNRQEFNEILSGKDLPTGKYTVKIIPIYKDKPIEESKPSASLTLRDLSRLPKAEFYFKPSINTLVLDKIESEEGDIAFNIYTSNKNEMVQVRQADMDRYSDSLYFGENFDTLDNSKLAYTFTASDISALFKDSAYTGELHVEVVDRLGDAKRTSPEATKPIRFITNNPPIVKAIAENSINSAQKFSKESIKKINIKTTENLTIQTQNADGTYVYLYRIKDGLNDEGIKNLMEKMHDARYKNLSESKIPGYDFFTEFSVNFLSDGDIVGNRPLLKPVEAGNAVFDNLKFETYIGKYIAVLQSPLLYHPVDTAYIELLNGEPADFTVGVIDKNNAFTPKADGIIKDIELYNDYKNIDEDREEIARAGIDLRDKTADIYLLNREQKGRYNSSTEKITFLENANNSIWKMEGATGVLKLGDTGDWQKIGDYLIISVDKDGNIAERTLTISDGTAPLHNDLLFYIAKESGRNAYKYLAEYSAITEKAELYFMPMSFEASIDTAVEDFIGNKLFSISLNPEEDFVKNKFYYKDGETVTSSKLDEWAIDYKNCKAYLVDESGNYRDISTGLNIQVDYPLAKGYGIDLTVDGGNDITKTGEQYIVPDISYIGKYTKDASKITLRYEIITGTEEPPILLAPAAWIGTKPLPDTGIPANEATTGKNVARVYAVNEDGKIVAYHDFTLNL